MRLNLDFLLDPPTFSARARLTIAALAPLSMVVSMPGKYYRCQPEPTEEMLYGLLENALGWHIAKDERAKLVAEMERRHRRKAAGTGVGFKSLLQFHLQFAGAAIPALLSYDDYWSQHLRGGSFIGGSRNYDYRAIPLMNAQRADRVTIGDRSERQGFSKDPVKLTEFVDGDNIAAGVLRPYFPQYYTSPTPRGYVEPKGAYKYIAECSPKLSLWIGEAITDPAAPLYLGSSDGWVEVEWEVLK